MTAPRLLTPILVVLAVLLAACGGASSPTSTPGKLPSPAATNGMTHTSPPPPTPPPTVTSRRPATAHIATPSAKAAILSLELASGQVAPGREFQLDVGLDPRGRGVSGVQFDLDFPLGQVEVLAVQPGILLGPDPLEIERMEHQPGVLVYAAARRGATTSGTPTGRFATLRFRVLDDVAIGTPLQIRLRAAQIADENIQRVAEVATPIPPDLVVAAP